MALNTPQEKGDALEEAVRLIETMILDTSPGAKDAVVTIESKKLVIVQGVKHEIDIYITIDYGRGYASRFIFECKNWDAKVDKDEIIVFSRKIQDVRAQKGYFIAKRFTKYAKAQAERDGVELLTADDVVDLFPPFLDGLPLLANNVIDTALELRFINPVTEKEDLISGYRIESFVKYGNEELLLRKLIDRIQYDIMAEEVGQLSIEEIAAFENEPRRYERTKIIGYQPGELFIEGNECYAIEIRLTWRLQVIRPTIVSRFDIKTRGRVITVETGKLPLGESLQISFIAID